MCSGVYRPLEATQSKGSVYIIDTERRSASRVEVKRPKDQVKTKKARKEGQNTFIYLSSRCFLWLAVARGALDRQYCSKRVGPELWRTSKVVPA